MWIHFSLGFRLLTDAAVVGVAACCLGLKVLDLDMLPLLSDMAISCLADGCRSLRVLSLKRAKLSDEAVAAFITASGSSLCEISLNSVRQVSFILQYNQVLCNEYLSTVLIS
jgi:DNA repair protein RAD7